MAITIEAMLTFGQLKALMTRARLNGIPVVQWCEIVTHNSVSKTFEYRNEFYGSRSYMNAKGIFDKNTYMFYDDDRDECPAVLLVRERDQELFRLML